MTIRNLAMITVCLGLFCFSSVALAESDADAESALAEFISLADGHIISMLDTIDRLALSPSVQSGDWDKMLNVLTPLKEQAVESAIWFANPDGTYFTVADGLTDKNLKDRDYFPTLMKGEPIAGPLVVSKSTEHKSVIVAVPVRQGDKIIGALGASIFLDSLSRTLRDELALPLNMIFFALDSEGRTTLNHIPERVFLDPRDQNDESMTAATDEMLEKKKGVVEYEFEGVKRTVHYATSPFTEWIYAIGILNVH